MGSGEQDKTILLHDYAMALSEHPEFVVWLACKWFWENDPNRFFPKIAEIKRLCDSIQLPAIKTEREVERIEKPSSVKMDAYYRDVRENPVRRTLCDYIKSKGGDDLFDVRSYSNYQLEILAKSKYGYREDAT